VGRYHPSITDGSSALSGQWLFRPLIVCVDGSDPWNSGIPGGIKLRNSEHVISNIPVFSETFVETGE
jgi:hypothetical protein